MRTLAALLVLATILPPGCSSKPPVGEVRRAYQESLRRQCGGLARLEDLRLLDVVAAGIGRDAVRIVRFEATVRLLFDGKYAADQPPGTPSGTIRCFLPGDAGAAADPNAADCRNGTLITVRGTIPYRKSLLSWTPAESLP